MSSKGWFMDLWLDRRLSTQSSESNDFLTLGLSLNSFLGQYFGGNFLTPTWAIGNSSSYDPNITQDTRAEGVGSGLAQTHNNFEGDHSMFQVDWHTSSVAFLHGLINKQQTYSSTY